MKTAKSSKRALLTAIFAMLLSVSMLVGTTFAWFTDSVTSSGNKIVAGNLDVELKLYNGTEYVNITDSSDPIFGEGSVAQNNAASTLWEPGKTQVVYLAIENAGTLALRYKVSLDVKNPSVNNIIDVLSYTITPDAMGGGAAPAWDANKALPVIMGEQVVSGANGENFVSLAPNTTHYFALSIHMDENAGNQYMGSSITFDISVLATQDAYEEDSFGNDYDGSLGDYTLNLGDGVTEEGMIQQKADGSKVFYSEESSLVKLMAIPEDVGTEYTVPAGVTDLGRSLAYNTEIDTLVLPTTLTSAFKALENSQIENVILPEGLEVIPDRLFYKAAVKNVVIPESVTAIEASAFQQCSTLESVVIPDTVQSIGANAFCECTSLTEIYIPDGVTSIEAGAFRNTKISSIVIPASVTSIGSFAFRDCEYLTEMYINAESCTIVADAFLNAAAPYPATVVYVKNDAMKAYVESIAPLYNTGFRVELAPVEVSDEASLVAAFASGANKVVLTNDIDMSAGITIPEGASLDGAGFTMTYAGTDSYHLVSMSAGSIVKNVNLKNLRVKAPQTAGDFTLTNVVIDMDNDVTGLSIVADNKNTVSAGIAYLNNVTVKGTKDAAHLDPNTQAQAGYTPYGDVTLGGTWGMVAVDCDFGSLHGWNTRNGSNVSLTNTTYSVFRMHYASGRTLTVNGVETAWSESDAIPVAHDVGGCWSVQPAFR